MAVAFSCTLRALEAEQPTRRGTALLLLGLPALWGAWAVLSPVPLWEVTETARLEVASATHPLTAVVGGRVVERKLSLGQEVKSGEAVVFLDAESERRALKEKQARRQALAQQLTALRREIQVETAALVAFHEARDVAHEESKAHAVEAQVRAEFAERQAEMTRRLRTKQAATLEEYRRDTAEAEARRSASSGLRLAVQRLNKERTVEEAERRARLARLESEVKKLEGESAVEDAGIHRLEHDMALLVVRAPVGGRVGELGEQRVGAVVRPGEKLGSVVPSGTPHAVALFQAASVGRIRPGQPARLRLDGYPWAQWGTLSATVTSVGNEPIEGRIRVELGLGPNKDTAIPLEHGLPGTAEIEVERATPIEVVLRAAGQFLLRRGSARQGGEP
jgi:membrane fusion protein (multidrug efflux system)